MLENSSFQKRCFLAFPMYCPYLNFKIWIICASMMVGVVGKSITKNPGYFSSGRFLIGKGLNVYCFHN
jgi:uncharacterized membrane protein YhhN